MHQEGILGVLGGMGPQATNTFYQRIIDRTQAESDQEHLRVLIWSDAKIPDRTAGILGTPDQAEAVYQHLLADAKLLERAGCTVLAIPCNTSHYFVDRIQQAYGKEDAIVINPAAYTHTSVAILDALKAVSLPAVEVHLSDVDAREPFRHVSYPAMACIAQVKGLGFAGYEKAILMLRERLAQ